MVQSVRAEDSGCLRYPAAGIRRIIAVIITITVTVTIAERGRGTGVIENAQINYFVLPPLLYASAGQSDPLSYYRLSAGLISNSVCSI